VKFTDAVQLHEIRRPWSADRLARDKHHCVAFLQATIVHQH
jgi:translation initiation factor 2 beta subunit (eIF-2beta)/eIF-5